MADIDEQLQQDLRDPEFSEGYAESFLDTYVSTQLKVLREQRHLTQKEVARKLETSQNVISRSENADYASWNINTLKKFARLYEVRLHISFETYGSLIGEMKRFGRKTLERAPRHADPVLYGPADRRKPSARFNEFQMQLFDAQRSAGARKAVFITPVPAPTAQGQIPEQPVAGGNVYFMADYRPERSGADSLGGVANHAR
jgi:transcriptional regulator with XRE-family HTH domain